MKRVFFNGGQNEKNKGIFSHDFGGNYAHAVKAAKSNP